MFPGKMWLWLFFSFLLFSRAVIAARERVSAPRRVVEARVSSASAAGRVVVVAGVARSGRDLCVRRERGVAGTGRERDGGQSAFAYAAVTSSGAMIGGCVGRLKEKGTL